MVKLDHMLSKIQLRFFVLHYFCISAFLLSKLSTFSIWFRIFFDIICSIYEGFKLVLYFGPYHKNIVNESQIAATFVFNDKRCISL